MTLLFPGSFDPVTLGHVDIATRASLVCSTLIVAVLHNPHKHTTFTLQERVNFLQDALGHINNIKIVSFSGLLVQYAQDVGATAIVRGVRNARDLESEAAYAATNRVIGKGIETIFLPASPQVSHISSSIVREAATFASSFDHTVLSAMVTQCVHTALINRYNNNAKENEYVTR